MNTDNYRSESSNSLTIITRIRSAYQCVFRVSLCYYHNSRNKQTHFQSAPSHVSIIRHARTQRRATEHEVRIQIKQTLDE
ncbi:hypothetical protein IF2G_00911 [Cordyceps javanica]|nr:hypothetical protein IF2G_00911 [Cordyceps javanica]